MYMDLEVNEGILIYTGRSGHRIPMIGLAMGWMRTEAVLENFRQGIRRPSSRKPTPSSLADGPS